MATATEPEYMVNEDFTPDDRQERLLDVLKDGRDAGVPWGYATVKRFSEETGLRKQYVNRALEGLLGAGWIEKPYRGMYRFVEDPRE
jgi:DNA-binding IclR family transcriptional regulator